MSAGTELTKAQHTPGPWKLERAERVDIQSPRETLVVRDTAETEFVLAIVGAASHPRAQANGRLIAAAPDLLNACRTALRRCEECYAAGHMDERTLAAMRAAILKAEGGAA